MDNANRNSNGRILGAIGALAAVALLSLGILAGSLFTRPAAAAAPDTNTAHAITVNGGGDVNVKPDMASLNFAIHALGGSGDEALAAYEKAAQALTAKLKALGLDDKDIVLQPASTWPAQQEPTALSDKTSGYYADGVITATVRNLDKLRDLAMEGLKSEQGIGISNIQYGLQDDTQARKDAMNKAIDNARSQADAVTAKLGLSVKEVVAVNVQGSFTNPIPYGAKDAMGAGQAGNGANFSDLGSRPDITVNVQVQVSYNFE